MEKKLIEVNDLINMSNKRKIIVEKSEDGRTRSKIKDGIYYYSLPENLYNEFCEQKEIVEELKRQKDSEYKRETIEEIEKIFRNRDQGYRNSTIDYKDIKRPKTSAKKKYKGNIKQRIKAIMAVMLIGASVGVGVKEVANYKKQYNAIANEVQNLSDKEIRDEIYDILKQEISNATNVDKEDITFETYQPDSGTERTEVTAGEKNYVNNRDLRSPINFGNTLSNKVAEIINHSNNNSDRKELIKQLKKAREFSEEKDLKVDGDNLKDVKQLEENER